MFGKVFGGPIVQLVEYHDGVLLFRGKKNFKSGSDHYFRVAGASGKPAKVKATVTAARPLDNGGYLTSGQVTDSAQQRELSRLRAYSDNTEAGMRQYPRTRRKVDIVCTDLTATSIDISTGGMQVETKMSLTPGQMLKLQLIPGLGCQSRVAWVQGQRAGLEFRDTDDATKLLLSRFAEGRIIPTAQKRAPSKLVAPPDYKSFDK